jgi:crossover junction endodeoxyribonuclease RusA
MTIEFYVNGIPAPQGSKTAYINKHTGRANVVDQNGATLKPWREDVRAAALKHGGRIAPGEALTAQIMFYLPRPKSHFRTGRNAGLLRDAAPDVPRTKPDLDKLVRAVLDALTSAGTYADDANVVLVSAGKFYADARPPGAEVRLEAWGDIPADDGNPA